MGQLLDLSNVRYGIASNQVSVEDAVKFMRAPWIVKKIEDFRGKLGVEGAVLDANDVQDLTNIVTIAYDIYNTPGMDPIMTDTEYDQLIDLLSMYSTEHDSVIVGDTMGEKKYHRYPMLRGTLTKIHYLKAPEEKVNESRKSLDSWVQSTEKLYQDETGQKINLWEEDIYVFPKWDGVSVVFNFDEIGDVEDALTRGFTKFNTAESVKQHFEGLTRPLRGMPYGMKTEIMVTENSLMEFNETYGKDYKQTRSIASGIINSDDAGEKDNYLVVMQLRYMEEGDTREKLCPEVFDHPFIKCKLKELDKIEEFAQNHRFIDGLRCDGAVIHIISPKVQEVLGRKDDRNNYEVAYKFTEEYGISKVTDIEFQVGLFGRVTPVVKFDPIKIKGNTISSASLGSARRMEYLGLAKGDQIKVLYDIIPYVIVDETCERSGKKPIALKEKCPSCGETLVREDAVLSCQNPECPCRKKGAILNYLIKMDIKGLSYETIDTLYDFGIVQNIKDIYKIRKNAKAILAIPGFGSAKIESWLEEIESKKNVPDHVLFGAIGISGCGGKTFEKVFQLFTVDDVLDMADNNRVDTITIVNGIGISKGEAILTGIRENKKLIKSLIEEVGYTSTTGQMNSVLFKVCFTKIRSPELEKWIAENGGKTVERVTADTDFVVIPQFGVTSNKTADANAKGVPVITVDELKKRVQAKYPVLKK